MIIKGVHRIRPRLAIAVRVSVVFAILAVCVLPLMTGCDLIDQLLGGGTIGDPQAVITPEVNDLLVDQGLNSDLRPPLMYDFSAVSSLDQYGDPIHKPNYEVGWDFGDGQTRAFDWNEYVLNNHYLEEGAYTITLTVRENSAYGNAMTTAQKTITIGPAMVTMLTGQVIAGLVISQYGWLGSAVRPINGWNGLGVVFVIARAVLTVVGH